MKGDYQWNHFRCEGCGRKASGRPLPDDWKGFGMSHGGGLAYWCSVCVGNSTMANESRPTQAEAVEVARRRRQLLQSVSD